MATCVETVDDCAGGVLDDDAEPVCLPPGVHSGSNDFAGITLGDGAEAPVAPTAGDIDCMAGCLWKSSTL